MGRRYEPQQPRQPDADDFNIEIRRGRSSSKRHAYPPETFHQGTASKKRCCAGLSRRTKVLLARITETVFVGVAFAMLVVQFANHPAYPPTGTGDQGTLPLILAAASLGVISFFVGFASLLGFFNWMADKGHKRCFLGYTAPLVDMIFVGITIFAVVRTLHNLGDQGMQCYANVGNYQGCMMLLIAMIMIIPGVVTALVSSWLEYRRIKKRNKAS